MLVPVLLGKLACYPGNIKSDYGAFTLCTTDLNHTQWETNEEPMFVALWGCKHNSAFSDMLASAQNVNMQTINFFISTVLEAFLLTYHYIVCKQPMFISIKNANSEVLHVNVGAHVKMLKVDLDFDISIRNLSHFGDICQSWDQTCDLLISGWAFYPLRHSAANIPPSTTYSLSVSCVDHRPQLSEVLSEPKRKSERTV